MSEYDLLFLKYRLVTEFISHSTNCAFFVYYSFEPSPMLMSMSMESYMSQTTICFCRIKACVKYCVSCYTDLKNFGLFIYLTIL